MTTPGPGGPRPLAGIRVAEFTHVVMGPACGLILADLGAEVVKVEPAPEGDGTRRLPGSGAGYFAAFHRNRRSLCLDLRSAGGMEAARRLIRRSDVVLENFRPGAMDRLGLGPAALMAGDPRLIYASCKGFLPGPYEHRTALDEVVQMMSGLAHMTGPPGRPLRAGSSVNDIMGGMWAAIGILAALREREATGRGRHVQSALFENAALLMAQHMAQQAVTGKEPPPMSVRRPAWPVYDVFATKDGGHVFVGVTTDNGWAPFLRAFGLDALADDPSLATKRARVEARERTLPVIAAALAAWTEGELCDRLEALGLPFARIGRPGDLFDDPHLTASGGLVPLALLDGRVTALPGLPVSFDGVRPEPARGLSAVGEDGPAVLADLGYDAEEIAAMRADGILVAP